MFANIDEIPAMTLQDIKETKHYGRTDGQQENSIPTTNKVTWTHRRTDGPRENSIPSTNKVLGNIIKPVQNV